MKASAPAAASSGGNGVVLYLRWAALSALSIIILVVTSDISQAIVASVQNASVPSS